MEHQLLTEEEVREPICLLMALDQNYLPQMKVLMTSAVLNNPGEHFCVFLLHSGIDEPELDEITKWGVKSGSAFEPIRVDEELFRSATVSRQYPKEMYYRLLAAQFLPDTMERVIYLDPDILIINPLRPLWELGINGKLFAAAAHTGKTELANNVNRIRLGVDHDYYNSGVLLMDLKQARDQIVPEQIFAFVEEHAKELMLPDQDLLNALFGDRIFPLGDEVWNYDARNYNNYLLRSSGIQDLSWVMQNTVILHFCGKAKPWKPGYFYRFGLLYQHYMQLARRDWNMC